MRSMLRELHGTAPAASPKDERVAIAPASASRVTFTRMGKYVEPGWNVPRGAQHVPPVGAERLVTFLASETGDETMSLFAFDAATGKSEVMLRGKDLGDTDAAKVRSREEELRRERQRDRSEGITSHIWAKRAKVLVLPHGGDVFVRDFVHEPNGSVRRLTKTPDAEIDPKPCETGERVAFVRKGELYSIDVATGKETALTTPSKNEGVTHGLSDFVAQEELGESSGFFWSPKCDRIAYLEVDDRAVEKVPVLGYRGDADLMMQRYPRAGARNPVVRLGIVDLATKTTKWIEKLGDPNRYLGRFTWTDDGKSLLLQRMTRDQKTLSLIEAHPATGGTTEVLSESSPAWVTFSPMRLLKKSDDFLFTSAKSGHRHLELRARKGALVRTLTSGDWDVESIAGVDEVAGRVLFTGTKDGALERHLYSVPLAGGDVARLTPERGVHSPRVDEAGTSWVDVHSAGSRPPRAVVVRDGKTVGELPVPPDPEIEGLGIRPVEYVTVKAADGEVLHGALLRPRSKDAADAAQRHPAVVMVYGGPESQMVFDSWSPHLLWQHLADRGFVVFQLDNRGTGGRGRAAAHKVHKQLGKLELEDQIAGAAWLASQPFVDGARIGIYGHSYGGFMAALAMLDGKGTFRAGVAGSPVTDWRLYDTGYTERYMETPQTNAAGYEASDLSKKAAGLSGKLLLTHAMMDENVHYAHTARLIDALVAADKSFELLVLPGERHGVRAPAARTYVPERVAEFFAQNL
jgi:dipeptidyl-peptidase-4